MKKKFFSMMAVLLITILMTSTVSAGAAIKLSKTVDWTLGSLDASGFVFGLGYTDVTVVLNARGIPEVICTNQGGNQAPGQNPAELAATGSQVLPGDDPLRKNGRSPFSVSAEPPATLPGSQGGCPNDNWIAEITFVFWTNATISVYQGTDPNNLGPLLEQQNYTCVTTHNPDSVTCTPVP